MFDEENNISKSCKWSRVSEMVQKQDGRHTGSSRKSLPKPAVFWQEQIYIFHFQFVNPKKSHPRAKTHLIAYFA